MLDVRPVGRGKLYRNIVDQIERQILDGTLKVGDQLPSERELAEAFNVGKPSVREALQVLETKGLIQIKHGELARVVRNDVNFYLESLSMGARQFIAADGKYLVQLMQVRLLIEVQVVRLLIQTPSLHSFANTLEALAQMRKARELKDDKLFGEGDACFHRGLVTDFGNDLLSFFYEKLFALLQEEIVFAIGIHGKSIDDALREHETIFELVRAGDPSAVDTMRAHLEGSSMLLNQRLEKPAEK